MKIEEQVCNLELAERLRELGVEQKSSFYWYSSNADTEWRLIDEYRYGLQNVVASFCYSAFTVAELGAMLPRYVKSWRWNDGDKNREFWNCESEKYHAQEQSEIEADARAKVVVYLLEKGLMPRPGSLMGE